MKIIALVITFISGLLLLLGVFLIKRVSNKQKVYQFSMALAFSVIIGLIIFDLLPEIFESFHTFGLNKRIIYFISFTLIGIIILKLLDLIVPAHSHDHKEKNDNHEEHDNHLYHIGLITSIALIIHNMIEGLAIYTVSCNSLKSGILMAIGVGLHNVPMGMEISSSLDMSHKENLKKIIIYLGLVLSPMLGVFAILINNNISDVFLGILMSLTCGMLIYISIFELFNEIKHSLKSKLTISGLFIGIVLMLISFLL